MRVNFGSVDPKEVRVILKRIRDDDTLNTSETARTLVTDLLAPYEPVDMLQMLDDGTIIMPQEEELSEFDTNLGLTYIKKYCGYLLHEFFTIDGLEGPPPYTGIEPEPVESLGKSRAVQSGLVNDFLIVPPTEAYGCPADNNVRSITSENSGVLDIGPNLTSLPPTPLDRIIVDSGLADSTIVPAGYFTAEIQSPTGLYHSIKHPTLKINGEPAEFLDQPVDELNIKFKGPLLSVITGTREDGGALYQDYEFQGVDNISLGHTIMAARYQFGKRTWDAIRPPFPNPADPSNPIFQTVPITLDEQGLITDPNSRQYYMFGGGRDIDKDIEFNIGVPSLELASDGKSAKVKFIDDPDPFTGSARFPGNYGLYVNNYFRIEPREGELAFGDDFYPGEKGDHFLYSKRRPNIDGGFDSNVTLASGITLTESNLVSWDTVAHTDIKMNMYYVHERVANQGFVRQEDAERPYVSTGGPNYVINGSMFGDVFGSEGDVGRYRYYHCFNTAQAAGGTYDGKNNTVIDRKYIVEIVNHGDNPNAGHASFNLEIEALDGKIIDVTNLTDLSTTNEATHMTTGFTSGRGDFLRRALHPSQVRQAGLGNCFNSHQLLGEFHETAVDELHCIEDISMCYPGMPVHGPFVPDNATIREVFPYEPWKFPEPLSVYHSQGTRVPGYIIFEVYQYDLPTTDQDESQFTFPSTIFYQYLHGNPDEPDVGDNNRPINTITVPYYDNIFFTDINGTRGGDGFTRLSDSRVSLDCVLRSSRPLWTDSKVIVVAFNNPLTATYKDSTRSQASSLDIPRFVPQLDSSQAGGVRIIDHDTTPFYRKYTDNQIDLLKDFYGTLISINEPLNPGYFASLDPSQQEAMLRDCFLPPDELGYFGAYPYFMCNNAFGSTPVIPNVRMHQQCSVDNFAYMNGVKVDRFFPEWTVFAGPGGTASDVWYIARPGHRADYITRTGADNPLTQLYGIYHKANNRTFYRHDGAVPESPFNPFMRDWPYDTRAYKRVLFDDKNYVPQSFEEIPAGEFRGNVTVQALSAPPEGAEEPNISFMVTITNTANQILKNWTSEFTVNGTIEDEDGDIENAALVSKNGPFGSPQFFNTYVVNGAGFSENIPPKSSYTYVITYKQQGTFYTPPPDFNQSFFVPLTIAEGGTDDNQGVTGTYDGEITEIGKLYSEELSHPFGTDPLNNQTASQQGAGSAQNFLPDDRIQNSYPFNYPYFDACTGYYKAPAGYCQLLVTVKGNQEDNINPPPASEEEELQRRCRPNPLFSRVNAASLSPSASIFLDNRHINKTKPEGLTYKSDHVPQGTITLEHGPSDTCYRYASTEENGGTIPNRRVDDGLPRTIGKNGLLISTKMKDIVPNGFFLGGANPCYGAILQGRSNYRRKNEKYFGTIGFVIDERAYDTYCHPEGNGEPYTELPIGWQLLNSNICSDDDPYFCCANCRCTMFSNSRLDDSFQKLGVSYIGRIPNGDDVGNMNLSFVLPYDSKITALVTSASSAPDMSCDMANIYPQWYDTNNAIYPLDGGPGSTNIDKPGFFLYEPNFFSKNSQGKYGCCTKPVNEPCPTFRIEMGSFTSCCENGFAAEGEDTDGNNPISVTISGGCVGSTSYGGDFKISASCQVHCSTAYVAMSAGRDISEEGGYYFPESLIDQVVGTNDELDLLQPEIAVYNFEGTGMDQEIRPGVTAAQAYRAREVRWFTSCGCESDFSIENIDFECPSDGDTDPIVISFAGDGGSVLFTWDWEGLFFQQPPDVRIYAAALARGYVNEDGTSTAAGADFNTEFAPAGRLVFSECSRDLNAGNICSRDTYDGVFPPLQSSGGGLDGVGAGFPIKKKCRGACWIPTPDGYYDDPSEYQDL